MLIYFLERERERERARMWEGQREGDRIQSGLCGDSRESNAGPELTNHEIMTRAEVSRFTG